MEQYDQIGARLDRLPLARFHYRIFGIISFSLLLTGFLSYSGNVVLAKLVSNGWSNNFLNAIIRRQKKACHQNIYDKLHSLQRETLDSTP